MFCVKCGTGLTAGMAVCPNCKNPVPVKKNANQPASGPTPAVGQPQPSRTPPAPSSAQGQGTIVHGVARPTPQDDTLVGTVLARRFRLIEKLGKGNMGVVYKAEDMEQRRVAAIKILTPDVARNPEFVARFQREAGLAGKINHPNAISTYDSGRTEDGLAYIAMEYLDGEPLGAMMKRSGPLPLDRVINITRQAAAALDAGHQLSIVHRDFKPDNVYLCRTQDGRDWVKVLDFGVAKQTAVDAEFKTLTQAGFVVGTPQYISPEQVLGEKVSPRSDLYSLAIVVYHMLTGGLPFSGKSPQQQMFNRVREAPSPIHQVNPDLFVPPEIEDVLMKALARHPEDRYASTLEFATQLENAANSEFSLPPQPVAPADRSYPPGAQTDRSYPPQGDRSYPPVAQGDRSYPPPAPGAYPPYPMQSGNQPYPVPGGQTQGGGLNMGVKIAIAVLILAVLVVLGIAIYFMVR
jgi:serine/threonine protein kinase